MQVLPTSITETLRNHTVVRVNCSALLEIVTLLHRRIGKLLIAHPFNCAVIVTMPSTVIGGADPIGAAPWENDGGNEEAKLKEDDSPFPLPPTPTPPATGRAK